MDIINVNHSFTFFISSHLLDKYPRLVARDTADRCPPTRHIHLSDSACLGSYPLGQRTDFYRELIAETLETF